MKTLEMLSSFFKGLMELTFSFWFKTKEKLTICYWILIKGTVLRRRHFSFLSSSLSLSVLKTLTGFVTWILTGILCWLSMGSLMTCICHLWTFWTELLGCPSWSPRTSLRSWMITSLGFTWSWEGSRVRPCFLFLLTGSFMILRLQTNWGVKFLKLKLWFGLNRSKRFWIRNQNIFLRPSLILVHLMSSSFGSPRQTTWTKLKTNCSPKTSVTFWISFLIKRAVLSSNLKNFRMKSECQEKRPIRTSCTYQL